MDVGCWILCFLSLGQAPERKVVVAGESLQATRQIQALDRLVDPLGSIEMLPKALGLAAPVQAFSPLVALVGATAERQTEDRWELILNEMQRLLVESPDALARVQGTLRQVRWLCHERITRLPSPFLKLYRQRVDADAQRLLQEAPLDPAPLRRLIEEHFASTWGERALLRLGDLAFERGQFGEALSWWSHLVPSPAYEDSLPYPAPAIDRNAVRYRQNLARSFQGDASVALDAKWAKDAEARARIRAQANWSQFGGSLEHDRTLSVPLNPRLWLDGPAWTVRLPRTSEMPGRVGADRQPPYFPLVVDGEVILADTDVIRAYNLVSGKQMWSFEVKPANNAEADEKPMPPFAPCAAEGRVFARLTHFLVCVEKGREVWSHTPNAGTLVGSPLVFEQSVFIVHEETATGRIHHKLLCLDAETGKELWSRDLSETTESEGKPRPVTLAIVGRTLVVLAHQGMMAGLDPWTGQRRWALRYPARSPLADDSPSARNQGCLMGHAGLVLAAPADCDRVLGIDAESGQIIWEREGLEVVHFLGVGKGRLVCTTPRGMEAFDARTGAGRGEWRQPTVGRLPSLGRGLIVGDWALWPTQDPQLPYRALNLADGEQEGTFEPTQLRTLLAGNLVFGQEALVSAGVEELACYLPAKLRILQDARSPVEKTYFRALAALGRGERQNAEGLLAEVAERGGGWKSLATQVTSSKPQPPRRDSLEKAKSSAIPVSLTADWPFLRSWEMTHTDALVFLEQPHGLIFLTWDRGFLRGHDRKTGRQLWSMPSDREPTWATAAGERILTVASGEIRAWNAADGKALWSAPTPPGSWHLDRGRPIWRDSIEPAEHFRADVLHVYYLEGGRRLVARDLDTGKLAYEIKAPGGSARPLYGAGRFAPNYHAGTEGLLLQTNHGQRWLIDAVSGRLVKADAAGTIPWLQKPLPFADASVLVGEERGRFLRVDLKTGRTVWNHYAPWPTSLTGAPGRMLGDSDRLLVMTPRNYGFEVERLDAASGRRLWRKPLLFREPIDWVLDDRQGYFVEDRRLGVFDLADGKLHWERTLPGTGWKLARHGSGLVATSRSAEMSLVVDPGSGLLVQRIPYHQQVVGATP